MNTQLVEWNGGQRGGGIVPVLPLAIEEARRRPVLLASIFAAIALAVLVFGLSKPSQFTSSTTILVEDSNIIEPLMKGRAVPTTVVDRAAIAREVAFSRKVMNEILETGGWLKGNPSPLEQERLINGIVSRTGISNPRDNLSLIEISYSDTDPQRAFAVTRRFAELIMQESSLAKQRESREAYAFIASQVGRYHTQLLSAEKKLTDYRRINPDARPGSAEEVARRIGELRTEVDRSRLDLSDQSSAAGVMQSHLARERSNGVAGARTSQLRSQLGALQAERAQLAAKYTDQHPDIVRVNQAISDLQSQARGGGGSEPQIGTTDFDPAFGGIRSSVAQARSRSAASAARVATGQTLLAEELERSNRINETASELAALTRDYEINRNLYQDLLERRENARVSMNLDSQRGGLNFRIQEPAALPLQATGMRLMHFAAIGLLVALVMPLLLLFGWVKLDPRVRTPLQIEHVAGLPVLGAIPMRTGGATARAHASNRLAMTTALLLAVPVAYALAMILR